MFRVSASYLGKCCGVRASFSQTELTKYKRTCLSMAVSLSPQVVDSNFQKRSL